MSLYTWILESATTYSPEGATHTAEMSLNPTAAALLLDPATPFWPFLDEEAASEPSMVLRSFPEGSKTRTAERPLSATTTRSSLSTAMSIGSLEGEGKGVEY